MPQAPRVCRLEATSAACYNHCVEKEVLRKRVLETGHLSSFLTIRILVRFAVAKKAALGDYTLVDYNVASVVPLYAVYMYFGKSAC